jgi:hypothetical protein
MVYLLGFWLGFVSNDCMIIDDELGKMWNEAVMTYFKVLSQHLSKSTEGKKQRNSVEIAGLWAEISTTHISNMNQTTLKHSTKVSDTETKRYNL